MIRVITGTAKNKKLLVPPDITRPMTDRIKTSIFDLIREFVPKAKVLDLFAGSGALGIEALSRGADTATFIDNNLKALQIIIKNLETTQLSEKAEFKKVDVLKYLQKDNENSGKYDLIFLDPPFKFTLEEKAQLVVLSANFLSSDGLLIFRFPKQENYAHTFTELVKVYEKNYGLSSVSFLKLKNAAILK